MTGPQMHDARRSSTEHEAGRVNASVDGLSGALAASNTIDGAKLIKLACSSTRDEWWESSLPGHVSMTHSAIFLQVYHTKHFPGHVTASVHCLFQFNLANKVFLIEECFFNFRAHLGNGLMTSAELPHTGCIQADSQLANPQGSLVPQ